MWRELGELRLLHLLEHSTLIGSVLGLLDTAEVVFPLRQGSLLSSTDTSKSISAPLIGAENPSNSVAAVGYDSNAGAAHPVLLLISHATDATATDNATAPTGTTSGCRESSVVTVKSLVVADVRGKERLKQARNSTMVIVAKAIIDALGALRSEGDKGWMAVSIGLYHISSSIFMRNNENNFITVNNSQFRLLTDLLFNERVSDWIVLGILLAADSFASYKYESESEIETKVKTKVKMKVKNDRQNKTEINSGSKTMLRKIETLPDNVLPIKNIFPEYHRRRTLLSDVPSAALSTLPNYFSSLLSHVMLPPSQSHGACPTLLTLIADSRPHLL